MVKFCGREGRGEGRKLREDKVLSNHVLREGKRGVWATGTGGDMLMGGGCWKRGGNVVGRGKKMGARAVSDMDLLSIAHFLAFLSLTQ